MQLRSIDFGASHPIFRATDQTWRFGRSRA